MARTTAEALERLRSLLTDPAKGVNAQLATIEARDGLILDRVADEQFALMNLPSDLADQALDAGYPAVYLFVEEAENLNREKFAYFSGPLRVGAEVRLSAEDPGGLEANIHRYIEALLNVLQASRGEWSAGLVYSGRFAVRFSATRLGGNNFLQSARLSIALEQFVAF